MGNQDRECKNCAYYKADYGTFCVNGWSRDGRSGRCTHSPGGVVTVLCDDLCGFHKYRKEING